MRIWIVNQYAIPPEQAGGTRHYFLARELVKRGHEVSIIASSFDHATRRETRLQAGELWELEEIDGIRFVWLRTPPYPGNTLARMWNMAVFSWRVLLGMGQGSLGRPDVVLGSSPHLFGAGAACRLADRHRAPFVLEVRDLWPQSLVDLGNVSAGHPLVRALEWIERSLYRRAARIISLLPGAVEHMVAKGADPAKVVWLPNGIDLDLMPAPAPPPENGVFTVMYAGAHGLANALDSIVDAAGLLQREGLGDRLQMRLVGEGPHKERLQQRARAEGIELLAFEPPVPKRRVFQVLQEADAFIVTLKDSPLYRWGISLNKLYDYLACARPVVFGSGTPYNPVAESGAGITVPPEDAAAMAGAIKQLIATPRGERWEMGRQGRAYVEKHHAFSDLGRRLEQVLLDTIAQR